MSAYVKSSMRLVNTGTLRLQPFDNGLNCPPYAVLSHCWGTDEVVFNDLNDLNAAARKSGFQKIKMACTKARKLGYEWLWADTICIDRSSSEDVSEAVNSNFDWYHQSNICIVYLSDVSMVSDQTNMLDQFRHCRWIQRSWTLQELIAPKDVLFYSDDWSQIGSKESFSQMLSNVTGIDSSILDDAACLADISIGKRMSWAATRSASRIEDIAYSLLGIFGVSMPVVYGEGNRAFIRLQEEILKDSNDASIFAWKALDEMDYRGLFAMSPREFAHFKDWAVNFPLQIQGEIFMTSGGISIFTAYDELNAGQDIVLAFSDEQDLGERPNCFGVTLREWRGSFVRSFPQKVLNLRGLPQGQRKTIRIKRTVDPRTSARIVRDLSCEKQLSHYHSDLAQIMTTNGERNTLGDHFAGLSTPNQCLSPPITSPTVDPFSHFDQIVPAPGSIAWCETTLEPLAGSTLAPSGLDFVDDGGLGSFGLIALKGKTTTHKVHNEMAESRYGSGDTHVLPLFARDDEDLQETESTEDDMYLFMSPLEPRPTLSPDHPFVRIKEKLVESALRGFYDWASLHTKRARSSSPLRGGKRLKITSSTYLELEQRTDLEDEDMAHIMKQHMTLSPTLACPFFARDKSLHQKCVTRAELRSISDVKRHLWLEHRLPHFCPVCCATFNSAGACDSHIRKRSCVMQSWPSIEGISEEQVQLLAKRFDSGLSVEEQWYTIWDIVFPEVQRPKNFTLVGKVESMVGMLQSYWSRNGRCTIAMFLDIMKLTEYASLDEERALAEDALPDEERTLAEYALPDEERALAALYAETLELMADKVLKDNAEGGYGQKAL